MIKYCSDDDHKMNETRKSKHFSDFNNSRLIDWFTTNRELQKIKLKKLGVIDCDEDKQMALETFKEIDVDGDGQVSKAEFVKIMSKFDCAYNKL